MRTGKTKKVGKREWERKKKDRQSKKRDTEMGEKEGEGI